MAFVTKKQADLGVAEISSVETESLVRDYKHRADDRTSARYTPLRDLSGKLSLGSFPINCERCDPVLAEPFDYAKLAIEMRLGRTKGTDQARSPSF